jgi:hypothetical protein
LKERTKELLSVWGVPLAARTPQTDEVFLLLFLQKKKNP